MADKENIVAGEKSDKMSGNGSIWQHLAYYFSGRASTKVRRNPTRKTENTPPTNTKYPLAELAKHAGEPIAIQYIAFGEEREYGIEMGVHLMTTPTEEAIIVVEYQGGRESPHHWIVYWDKMVGFGGLEKRCAIKSIRDMAGNIIYENTNLPFDHENVVANTRRNSTRSGGNEQRGYGPKQETAKVGK